MISKWKQKGDDTFVTLKNSNLKKTETQSIGVL